MSVDLLANALNVIKVHENRGLNKCVVPSSKVIKRVLDIFKSYGYIKDYEVVSEHKKERLLVHLDGRINNCGIVKPRESVKRSEWAEKEKRFIPGVGIGLLIATTPEGIMTNREAEGRKIGGRLMAYVY